MRDYQIRVAPFSFLSYEKIEICLEPNEHGKAIVVGVILEENEKEYVSLAIADTNVSIFAIDDTQTTVPLFTGVIEDFTIYSESGLRKLKILLVTASIKMDMVEITRTFQNETSTYHELLQFIGDYPGYNFIMHEGEGSSLEKMIVQYKESDWVFIKRMASHFNTSIIVDYKSEKVRYHFGVPTEKPSISVNPISYSMKKILTEYTYKTENEVEGFLENDAIYYELVDREIYELGQPITLSGKSLYIYSIISRLEKGELKHYYQCKTKNGFKVRRYTNLKVIGSSLAGVVDEVMTDVLRVFIFEDTRVEENRKWHPYSTVYSSPDGTGWYAMPEPGDEIRLYFPSDEEDEGYVINSVHLEPSNGELRQDPDKKSLRNKYGKEIQFTPTLLFMTNNNGLSITLNDEDGITILSDKKVTIAADESIFIDSVEADIQVIATEGIEMQKAESRVSITDNILFEGQEIDIQ